MNCPLSPVQKERATDTCNLVLFYQSSIRFLLMKCSHQNDKGATNLFHNTFFTQLSLHTRPNITKIPCRPFYSPSKDEGVSMSSMVKLDYLVTVTEIVTLHCPTSCLQTCKLWNEEIKKLVASSITEARKLAFSLLKYKISIDQTNIKRISLRLIYRKYK